jgi:hypothetical protein
MATLRKRTPHVRNDHAGKGDAHPKPASQKRPLRSRPQPGPTSQERPLFGGEHPLEPSPARLKRAGRAVGQRRWPRRDSSGCATEADTHQATASQKRRPAEPDTARPPQVRNDRPGRSSHPPGPKRNGPEEADTHSGPTVSKAEEDTQPGSEDGNGRPEKGDTHPRRHGPKGEVGRVAKPDNLADRGEVEEPRWGGRHSSGQAETPPGPQQQALWEADARPGHRRFEAAAPGRPAELAE